MGMKYKIKKLVNVLNVKISRITFVSYEQLISGYYMCNLEKKNWPLFMDMVQLPEGWSHFEEAVYFLSLSPQKFLVLTF